MPAPLLPIALGLAQFAPALMRFFGAGDASTAVAEKVVGIAQTITGATSPEAALEAIRANTAAQAKFNELALQLDGELERAYLADRADARARDVAIQSTGRTNVRANWMVALDVVGLLACLATLIFFRDELPGEVVGIVSTVCGIFGACLRDAHQFEFGSSRGSKDRGEEQAAILQKLVAEKQGPKA